MEKLPQALYDQKRSSHSMFEEEMAEFISHSHKINDEDNILWRSKDSKTEKRFENSGTLAQI